MVNKINHVNIMSFSCRFCLQTPQTFLEGENQPPFLWQPSAPGNCAPHSLCIPGEINNITSSIIFIIESVDFISRDEPDSP